MDENVKSDVTLGDEQVAVTEIEQAVKTIADKKSTAFGPDDATLVARQAELQRQKVQLHQEGPNESL